jgi:N-acetylglucosaminyldiphosphoundecaprenol N-acetyl-beta-D-mannosaminyltransferase
MENLVSDVSKKRIPVALIGGRAGLALTALECLQKAHPNLSGWAVDGPGLRITNKELQMMDGQKEVYFQALAKRIIENGVRMVFVGLGAPKQEYFIEELSKQLSSRNLQFSIIFMSVGGSFDEISGRVPRAPQWVSQLGLKWFWRLILEPWRIRRQFALLQFILFVLKERYTLK